MARQEKSEPIILSTRLPPRVNVFCTASLGKGEGGSRSSGPIAREGERDQRDGNCRKRTPAWPRGGEST
jgi:hypothetical protein